MTLKLITEPSVEPLTLDQARLHCRVDPDYTTEDATLTALIIAARRMAEHELGRALVTQTWEEIYDEFPPSEIELTKPGVLSIVSVKYLDTDGVQQTIDSANYTLDAETLPGYVHPVVGYSWPSTIDSANAVRVRFTCGYGPAATDVPGEIVAWIKMQLSALWENRKGWVEGVSVTPLPNRFIDSLLDRERVYGV